MKAYTRTKYGGPEVLRLGKFKIPDPAPDQLLVRVNASSVNPADWHVLRGTPYMIRLMMGFPNPKNQFLGADVSGVVEKVGSEVQNFKKGDEVFGDIMNTPAGSYSEYVCVQANFWIQKPVNISHEEAAASPLAAVTALQGLRDHGQLKSGQRVLINGASGGVGTYAVQFAKYLGANVSAVCSTSKVSQTKALGADKVIDYSKETISSNTEAYDLIFDGVGNIGPFHAKQILKKNGKCLLIGWGGFSHMIKYMMSNLFIRGKSLDSFTAKMKTEDLRFIASLLESGKIKSVIDRTFPFDQLKEAIQYQEKGHASGKVIISM